MIARLKDSATARGNATELPARVGLRQSPELARIVEKLFARYRKYAVPVAELRKELGKEMGERTLTQELDNMREGR